MPDSLARLASLLALLLAARAQQNVVLSSTDPDIIYNPPLCSPSSALAGCTSPWQVSNSVVYTDGPIPQAGNVIPQMFLNFRASTIYLQSTSSSNATVNFTLTAEPADLSITTEVNTSISLIVAVDLPESQTTTLGVTFLQGATPARFDIESITLTVANASATASFLPSPSLPVSSSPPTLAPSPTLASASSPSVCCDKPSVMSAVLVSVLVATSIPLLLLL